MTNPKKCKCGGEPKVCTRITSDKFKHYFQCSICGKSTSYHDCEKSAAVEWKKMRGAK